MNGKALKLEERDGQLRGTAALEKDDDARAVRDGQSPAASAQLSGDSALKETNAPAQANGFNAAPESASMPEEDVEFGKFKSADSLFEAYNRLEARFTKKCQRLRELEQYIAADNAGLAPAIRSKENPDANPQPLDPSGLSNEVCDITQAVPDTVVILQDVVDATDYAAVAASAAASAADTASAAATSATKEDLAILANDEDFLNDYIYNNKTVKSKIISMFVKELSDARTPKTISGYGGGNIITPVHRPKTLTEAKQMTEFLFNK
jgi:hypothetical protein